MFVLMVSVVHCINRCKVTPVFYVNSALLSLNTHSRDTKPNYSAQCIIFVSTYKNILSTGTFDTFTSDLRKPIPYNLNVEILVFLPRS